MTRAAWKFPQLLVFLATIAGASARAADVNLALDRFDPSPAGDRMFGSQSPFVNGHLVLDARVLMDYAHNPLVLRDANDNSRLLSIVQHQAVLYAGASLGLFDRVSLNFDLPLIPVQSGEAPNGVTETFTQASGAHLADVRVGARVRAIGSSYDLFQLSFGAFLWLPLGSSASESGAYASDGTVRGRIQLIAGGRNERFLWTLAAGPDIRKSQTYLAVSQGSMMRIEGGAGFLFQDGRLQVGPEFSTALKFSDVTRYNSNAELLVGGRYRLLDRIEAGLALGPGLTSGIGTPDLRVVASLGWAPPPQRADRDEDGIADRDDACPSVPGVESADPARNGCPPDQDLDGIFDAKDACPELPGFASADPARNGCPPDRDGDGLYDAQDACPDESGAASEDPTDNGCPDRDGDGVVDPKDACPDLKGVASSDAKRNGCPPDRDGDGVLDDQDACPDVPGVASQDASKNGCPPDKDGDGIPDDQDACPSVPGGASEDPAKHGCPGDRDGDGIIDPDDACPDAPGAPSSDPARNGCPSLKKVVERVIVLEGVTFDTDRDTIRPESDVALRRTLESMELLPKTQRFRIEGHTDDRGPAWYNRDLSLRRATAVVRWFVEHGLDASRFDSQGFGPAKPVAANATEEGRQKNRRVEIHFLNKN